MDETPNPLLQWQEDVREIAEVLARRSGTSILEEGPEALTLYRVRFESEILVPEEGLTE